MRYAVLLILYMTAFFTDAQSVNNPTSEIAAVNPQPDSSKNQSGENDLLGLPPVPIPANNPQNARQN
ncbi:MAG: hypothetical protein ACXWT3_01240 [Methylococcaceae bacterium]